MQTEFEIRFKSEEDCLNAIKEAKWPNGYFQCPDCGHEDSTQILSRNVSQCRKCKKQVSITSGTFFHRVKVPLLKLFRMLWKIATGSPASTAQVSRELELAYSTTWVWTQKFRILIFACDSSSNKESVHWSKFKKVLFRRSSETARKKVSAAKSRGSSKKAAPSLIPAALQQPLKFIADVFHGISKKYSQIYLSSWDFNNMQFQDRFSSLLKACLNAKPIGLNSVLAFSSPEFLSIHNNASCLSISVLEETQVFDSEFAPDINRKR